MQITQSATMNQIVPERYDYYQYYNPPNYPKEGMTCFYVLLYGGIQGFV